MNKFLGFCGGQYGDLYLGTCAARILKKYNPGSNLTLIINNDYKDCAPLFLNHPNIDSIHILDQKKDGFNQNDINWINKQKFDHVFNPMADHRDQWWKYRNQGLEAANMHGLNITGETAKLEMTKWFNVQKLDKTIAISPYAGYYAGLNNDKCLSIQRAQDIVNIILDLGYLCVQIGGPGEPELIGAIKCNISYFESVRTILGCRAIVIGDTGINWLLSSYDFPVLGLYSHRYYGPNFVNNIQPLNNNAIYLDADNVNNISLDLIKEKLKLLIS